MWRNAGGGEAAICPGNDGPASRWFNAVQRNGNIKRAALGNVDHFGAFTAWFGGGLRQCRAATPAAFTRQPTATGGWFCLLHAAHAVFAG